MHTGVALHQKIITLLKVLIKITFLPLQTSQKCCCPVYRVWCIVTFKLHYIFVSLLMFVLNFRHSDSANQNVSKTSRRSEIQEKPDGPKLLERHQERSWQWWADSLQTCHICWFGSSNTLFFSRITLLSLRNAEMHLLNITGISGKRQVMFPWRFRWYAFVTWLLYWSVLIFTVEAMKRVEEIKQKRQARFIMNRWATSFIFLYFVHYIFTLHHNTVDVYVFFASIRFFS